GPSFWPASSRKASSHAWRRTICIRRSWRSFTRVFLTRIASAWARPLLRRLPTAWGKGSLPRFAVQDDDQGRRGFQEARRQERHAGVREGCVSATQVRRLRQAGDSLTTMLKLVIANKLYSSWSLRPWMVLAAFDIPFEEIVIPLRVPESRGRVLEFSPSGKVPALIDGEISVWESLAIIEYLADAFPDRAIWPRDRKARAH